MKKSTILLLYILFSSVYSYAQIIDSLTVEYFGDSIQNRKAFRLEYKSNVIEFKVLHRNLMYTRTKTQEEFYNADILIKNLSDELSDEQVNEILISTAHKLEVEVLVAFKDYRAYQIFYQSWTKHPNQEKHLKENLYYIDLSEK